MWSIEASFSISADTSWMCLCTKIHRHTQFPHDPSPQQTAIRKRKTFPLSHTCPGTLTCRKRETQTKPHVAIHSSKDKDKQIPLVTAIVERMKLIHNYMKERLKWDTSVSTGHILLTWNNHWPDGHCLLHTWWIWLHFSNKIIASVVISDCLNVT